MTRIFGPLEFHNYCMSKFPNDLLMFPGGLAVFAASTVDIPDITVLDKQIEECIPEELLRTDKILQHPFYWLKMPDMQTNRQIPDYMNLQLNSTNPFM